MVDRMNNEDIEQLIYKERTVIEDIQRSMSVEWKKKDCKKTLMK